MTFLHRVEGVALATGYSTYAQLSQFFPLVGSVLKGTQQGVVLADSPSSPTQWYVEHRFGFAQMFGVTNPVFEEALGEYLFVKKAFRSEKVRLYAHYLPREFKGKGGVESERQRYHLDKSRFHAVLQQSSMPTGLFYAEPDAATLVRIEEVFGVVTRFWSTPEDFAHHAKAVVGMVGGQIASLCYAAAVVEGRAEIDVCTLAQFRGRGIGRYTVIEFVQRALATGIEPLWDCFTNNEPSVKLARSAGFTRSGQPYPFLTIDRK